MTPESIQKWSQLHGYTEEQAAIDLKLLQDVLNKKSPCVNRAKDMIPNFSIEQIGW